MVQDVIPAICPVFSYLHFQAVWCREARKDYESAALPAELRARCVHHMIQPEQLKERAVLVLQSAEHRVMRLVPAGEHKDSNSRPSAQKADSRACCNRRKSVESISLVLKRSQAGRGRQLKFVEAGCS